MNPSPLSSTGLPRPRRWLPIVIAILAVVAVCSIPIAIYNKICFSLKPIPSPAYTNVIVSNGVALVPQTTGLTAYRLQDGSKLWSVPDIMTDESIPNLTLVVDNQSAYEVVSHNAAQGEQFTVLVRDLQAGTLRWQRTAQVQPPGYRVSEQLVGGVLVIANFDVAGTLSGLDTHTGQPLWQAQVVYGNNPNTIANDGKNVFVWNQNGLVTMRASDGKALWHNTLKTIG